MEVGGGRREGVTPVSGRGEPVVTVGACLVPDVGKETDWI